MQKNDNVLDPNVLPGPKGYCFRFFHCPWRLEEGTTFDSNLPSQPDPGPGESFGLCFLASAAN